MLESADTWVVLFGSQDSVKIHAVGKLEKSLDKVVRVGFVDLAKLKESAATLPNTDTHSIFVYGPSKSTPVAYQATANSFEDLGKFVVETKERLENEDRQRKEAEARRQQEEAERARAA